MMPDQEIITNYDAKDYGYYEVMEVWKNNSVKVYARHSGTKHWVEVPEGAEWSKVESNIRKSQKGRTA